MKDEKKKLFTRIIDEYKKVTWASKAEVLQVTIIVLLITIFITIMIVCFDYIFNIALSNITNILKSIIK